jgi:hypothetical protein
VDAVGIRMERGEQDDLSGQKRFPNPSVSIVITPKLFGE